MEPHIIGKLTGIVLSTFIFGFPAAIVTAVVYAVASFVNCMAAWLPVLEVLLWVFALLCVPLVLLVLYVVIAGWWINRG